MTLDKWLTEQKKACEDLEKHEHDGGMEHCAIMFPQALAIIQAWRNLIELYRSLGIPPDPDEYKGAAERILNSSCPAGAKVVR